VNTAPRGGFVLSLTGDGKTVLKGGAGFFYDRVPLNVPAFRYLPGRTVTELNSAGEAVSSTRYSNVISNGLQNPRSEVWNVELNREVTSDLLVRVGYQQRGTVHGYFVNPIASGSVGSLSLSDRGSDIYLFQQVPRTQVVSMFTPPWHLSLQMLASHLFPSQRQTLASRVTFRPLNAVVPKFETVALWLRGTSDLSLGSSGNP
jgi:hypothetical protein